MYCIGVDYHKRYSHMTVLDAQGQVVTAGIVPNTAEGVRTFVAPYRAGGRAAVEATRNWTVIYDLLEAELEEVQLAHPLKVRAIAEARIKTDRISSWTLAHLLRCDLLPTAYVRPKAERPAQLILRQRMFFVRVQTMVKNRIHVLVDRQPGVREVAHEFSDLFGAAGLTWLRTVALPAEERQLLDSELELLEELRRRIAQSNALVKQLAGGEARVAWVQSIPGFGPFLSVLVVIEIGDIARFAGPEKLCAYAGLVPSVYASGGKVFHGRLIKQGNKWLRWALVEAIAPAVGSDAELREYYDRLRQRKGPNAAKVATARRLLTIVYRVLSQARPYEVRRRPGRKPWHGTRTALRAS